MKVAAIDQGTTSTRVVIVGSDGRAEVAATYVHAQSYPRPGWVEHDPLELLAHVRASCEVAQAHGAVAVGLDNQGESCLAWDAVTREPLSPVLVWQDERSSGFCETLRNEGLEDVIRQSAGLPVDPYFSAPKLRWLLDENALVRSALREGRLRLGTTDAYFRDCLTGRFETDPTTASRTSLMNLATCAWDEDLCAVFGVPVECLPAIGPSTGDFGLAGRGLLLAASLVDQQASLYGHGCRGSGDAKVTFGTGAFALAVTGNAPQRGTSAVPTIAWQKAGEAPVYAVEGGVFSASSALNWAREMGVIGELAEITDLPDRCLSSEGLVFVPALSGLGCPHWNRDVRGAWFGLGLDTTRQEMGQAMLEGIAFLTAEVLAELARSVPLRSPLSIDGGMSANRWFCQFLADAADLSVSVSQNPELTATGAAMLAAEAVGADINQPGGRVVLEPRRLPDSARESFAAAMHAAGIYAGRHR